MRNEAAEEATPTGAKTQELVELIRVFLPPERYEIVPQTAYGRAPDILVPYDRDGNARKRYLYERLSALTGRKPPWGILTGVRPVKRAGDILREEGDMAAAKRRLMDTYLLNEAKAEQLLSLCIYQEQTFGHPAADSVGVYIGIPFCPTRCLYCSFASNEAEADEIARYLVALRREIRFLGDLMREQGLVCESLYLGGGTPTTLSAEQLADLLDLLGSSLPGLAGGEDVEDPRGQEEGRLCREITLEGGRPDTFTPEKLRAAKRGGVTRLSINPQTMKEETLRRIGRGHTAEEIRRAFAMAREEGFTDINADLIAGLPGEEAEDFHRTLCALLALDPEGITVHTLAVKRSSGLHEEDRAYHYRSADVTNDMLRIAEKVLPQEGYLPYYLYRQKNMAGAGENTGWCRAGHEGLYNVRIMEERQSILAAGAGGMSKRYDAGSGRLSRSPNLTNYRLYIERLDEMLRRKQELFATR